MRPKKESLLLGLLLKKLAPKVGARVALEPEWGVVGQITFRNGRKSYFRYNTLDLNPVGASDVAKDKDYAAFFMQKMGYPAIRGKAFFSDEWCQKIGSKRNIDAAWRYAKRQGLPLVVKPNSGSHGNDVFAVRAKAEFYRAMRAVFKHDRIALVQKKVMGRDYRVVVLDGTIISAYERIPLNVVGDGRSSIKQLLARKQKSFVASSRDTRIRLDDPRILHKLKSQKLTIASIPKKSEYIYLLDNANLSSGGDAVDVTNEIHPEFKKLASRLARDMGLRLAGVDLMIEGSISDKPGRYWILEINAAPGLDHYVKSGKEQRNIVEAMYLKVLRSLATARG